VTSSDGAEETTSALDSRRFGLFEVEAAPHPRYESFFFSFIFDEIFSAHQRTGFQSKNILVVARFGIQIASPRAASAFVLFVRDVEHCTSLL
jgi:hypothetical protein